MSVPSELVELLLPGLRPAFAALTFFLLGAQWDDLKKEKKQNQLPWIILVAYIILGVLL